MGVFATADGYGWWYLPLECEDARSDVSFALIFFLGSFDTLHLLG